MTKSDGLRLRRHTAPTNDLCDALASVMQRTWMFKKTDDVLPSWKFFVTPRYGGELWVFETEAGVPVGFVFATPAVPERVADGPVILYCDLVAVLPEYQNAHLGEQMLRALVASALERGFAGVHGTYDPLEGPNASLYVRKFGAVGIAYVRDYFGRLSGEKHGGASDRLLIEISRLGVDRTPVALPAAVLRLGSSMPENPHGTVGVALPRVLTEDDRAEVQAWLRASLAVLVNDHGYRVVGFVPGDAENTYVLTRPA
jgi:predicted GNAT superfamily acetyltransferase